MKKVILSIIASMLSFYASAFSKVVTPADLDCKTAVYGEKLELGQWYTNFEVCKAYADANDVPLIAIWSNHGCIHCYYLDVCFLQSEFKEWQNSSNAAKAIWCFMAGGELGYPDQQGSPAYSWMYRGGGATIPAYPFFVIWHKVAGTNVRTTGDIMRDNLTMSDTYIAASTKNVIKNIELALDYWNPEPTPEFDDVSFKMKNDSTMENAGTYQIEVVRSVGTNSVVSAKLIPGQYDTNKLVVVENEVTWKENETGSKFFTVSINDDEDIGYGYSVDFTLETNAESSKTSMFTLKVVDDDKKAPTFETESISLDMFQYASINKTVQLKSFAKTTTVRKTGTLPTGVKVVFDNVEKCLVISGMPTKTGKFVTTFQATETIDGKLTTGNILTATFVVTDISVANPLLAKTVVMKNGLVMHDGELVGLMDLTIPKTGKITAKFANKKNTVSMTATGWKTIDGRQAIATTNMKLGMTTDVIMHNDGLVEAYVNTDDGEYEVVFDYAKKWSKDEFAQYAGTYNMSFSQLDSKNVAKCDGYASMKISSSSYSTGKVSISGMLPDGRTFSASSTLQYDSGSSVAIVPIFFKNSYDVISAIVAIKDDKTIAKAGSSIARWYRFDKYINAANTVEDIRLTGALFDKNVDLMSKAIAIANTTNFTLTVDLEDIPHHYKYGNAIGFELPDLLVMPNKVALDKTMGNANKLSVSYSKTTGLTTGSLKIYFENGTVSGTIKGMMFDSLALPVSYVGNVDGKSVKCGFNVLLGYPGVDQNSSIKEQEQEQEEDCGCN